MRLLLGSILPFVVLVQALTEVPDTMDGRFSVTVCFADSFTS